MDNFFIRFRRFLHYSDSGFTITELLVASTIGLIMMGLTLSSTLVNRRAYLFDAVRTRLNQDIRGTLDVIGMNVKEAGENLTSTFPAIQVIDGGGSAPDQLVLRRNVSDKVLNVCTTLASGSSTANIFFSNTANTSGCSFGGNTGNYTAWNAYRLLQTGQTTTAYIIDLTSKLGQFFPYTTEGTSGGNYYVHSGGATWSRAYTVGSAAMYLIEEWRFRLVGTTLELIEQNDTANPLNVAFDVTNLQVQIDKQDGTTVNTFAVTDNWTQIKSINVTITEQDTFSDDTITTSLTGKYFPRNILSN